MTPAVHIIVRIVAIHAASPFLFATSSNLFCFSLVLFAILYGNGRGHG